MTKLKTVIYWVKERNIILILVLYINAHIKKWVGLLFFFYYLEDAARQIEQVLLTAPLTTGSMLKVYPFLNPLYFDSDIHHDRQFEPLHSNNFQWGLDQS